MIRRRSFVAPLAATLVAGLLAMIPGTPAALAAAKSSPPRLVEQTETADVYANDDGTNSAVFYAGPVNFFDKSAKQWRKIDKQFRQVGGHIENGAGPIQVQLPSEVSGSDPITVGKDDWSVSFAFENAKSKRPAKISNGQVRYDDVAPGISLEYRMLSDGLKEDIVLDQAPSAAWPGYYRFRLSADGLNPVAVDGDTAVSLQDADGHELARMPRGTMVDASRALGTVDMKLGTDQAGWFVDVVPDSDFIASSARTYPLRIDPEVEYTWYGTSDTSDAFVGSLGNGQFGRDMNWDSSFLRAGKLNGGSDEYYSFLRFGDMTRIRGKAVTWSQLRMYATYEDDPSNLGWTAHLTKSTWNESTITWNRMLAGEGSHGIERIDIDANQQLGPGYYADTRAWAQAWANGSYGELINNKWSPYGITINTAGESAWYDFGSSESGDVNTMPALWVKYINQTPNLITTMSPADNWVGNASPALSAVFSDPDDTNGKIEYWVDGALYGPFTTVNGSTAPNFGLGAGPHTWQVRGIDANSYGPWSAVRHLTINTAPSVPDQLSPADGYYNTTLPALSARFLDNAGNGTLRFEVNGVTYSVGGIANGATGSCTTANLCLPSTLAPGLHSWRVQAVDALGLPSNWSPYQQFEYHRAGQVTREEYPVNGSQWGTNWATSSGLTVANNQGVFPAVTASKRATATGAYLQDSDVSLTYAFPEPRSAGTELRITLRGSGATGSAQLPTGYRLDIPSGSNTMSLKKLVNDTVSTLGSFTYLGPLDASQVRVRFRVDGSTISVKVWAAGALEPAAWSLERTDSTVTAAGTLQIAHSYQPGGASRTIYVDNVTYQNRSFWGVDSSKPINQARLNTLNTLYGGRPAVWGRYLTTQFLDRKTYDTKFCPRCGLNEEDSGETAFAQANHIPILVIERNSDTDDLRGEQLGRNYADLAKEHAVRLGIPTSVAIFANIEANAEIDSGFIWGWFDQLDRVHGYKVGYYANTRPASDFTKQFCAANTDHARVGLVSFIYASQPSPGRTKESEAPPYAPFNLNCGVVSSTAWQYGLAGQDRAPNSTLTDHPQAYSDPTQGPSDFDTDLIKPELADVLWYPGGVSCPAPRGASC
jgi:hypothetical protein